MLCCKFKIEKLSAVILEFVLYGFIGWTYETVITSISWGHFADRGWLHLPICPIYGFCAFFLLLILGRLKSIPLIFLAGTAVTTAAELAASYLLELFIDERLWDYYDWKFNFDGRVSLFSSLIFGAMCVLLIKVLHPAAIRITGKMSVPAVIVTAAVMLAAILMDIVATLEGL